MPYQLQDGPSFISFVVLKQIQVVLVDLFSNIFFVFYQVHNSLTKHVYSSSFTMSDHSNHKPPAATDPALDLTGAQRSDAASDGYVDGTADTRNTSPSTWDLELFSGSNLHLGLEQRLTPGDPSTSFAQPLFVDDDLSPEIGQSVDSDALITTQQEPSTSEGVVGEIVRQPPSVDDDLSDPFNVSLASESDLEILSRIHAQASASDPLACCTMQKPEDFDDHLKLGRFYYSQAFAAKKATARKGTIKRGTVILKVTNQDLREVVGCAWLQLHKKGPIGPPDASLSHCLETQLYEWVHTELHKHHQAALEGNGTRTHGTRRYSKYRYFAMFHNQIENFATKVSGQYDN